MSKELIERLRKMQREGWATDGEIEAAILKATKPLTEQLAALQEEHADLRRMNAEATSLAKELTQQRDLAVEALEKIAAPVRADGTYNRCREACEILARETLSAIKKSEGK